MRDGALMRIRPGPGGFFSGALSVFWGLGRLLGDRRLRRLAILPLLLTSVFYAAVVFLVFYFAGDLLALLWSRPDSGILRVLWYVVLPFVIAGLLMPFVLFFASIAELIGGPFYDRMAMRVLEDHRIPFEDPGFAGAIGDLFRSILFALAAATCALFALIPGVGIAFAIAGAVIAWLGLASAAINSALAATGLGLGQRVGYTLRAFATMAGVGAVIWVSLFVPFVGLLSIPSAVVGASELYARSRQTVQ